MDVEIPVSSTALRGDMMLPRQPVGVVVFAHGSGSSRRSSRNRYVARALVDASLGTLLFDLLTRQEEEAERVTRHLRFDIELLSRRLVTAIEWLSTQEGVRGLPIGAFGASTGAAAALVAAAERPQLVKAVVSRGGRPDLASPALPRVRAPTLLVVGGDDPDVLVLNRAAMVKLGGPKQLVVIPGAGHLFEEPGALQSVATHASSWFQQHLAADVSRPPPRGGYTTRPRR